MKLQWNLATRAQLCEIAYNDAGAPLEHKIAAAAELKRRNKQKFGRKQYREKVVYGR
jgi:hypothetical protein